MELKYFISDNDFFFLKKSEENELIHNSIDEGKKS